MQHAATASDGITSKLGPILKPAGGAAARSVERVVHFQEPSTQVETSRQLSWDNDSPSQGYRTPNALLPKMGGTALTYPSAVLVSASPQNNTKSVDKETANPNKPYTCAAARQSKCAAGASLATLPTTRPTTGSICMII